MSGELHPAIAALVARPAPAGEPRWLARAREQALARFQSLGLPTTRDEDWKYTNLSVLGRLELDDAPAAAARFAPLEVQAAARAVFVDGALDLSRSELGLLPAGVRIESLAKSWSDASLEALFASYEESDGIKALNSARFTDGARVRIARGVRLEKPIHLVFVTSPGKASFVRNLIELEPGADARVIEEFPALEGAARPGLTNAVTQAWLAPAARLSHVKVQGEAGGAIHLADLWVRQSRDSRFESFWISLGGGTARNEIRARLGEENAEVSLLGLYAGTGREQVDGHTVIDHASPRCRSEEIYKGIMAEEARGAFTGRIVVRKDAQKTDSTQLNRNLLLSDRAIADTRPQLQIHADDVKCSHGATIGRLDPEQLYYLRSRGIGIELARRLVSRAFGGEILDRLPEDLRGPVGERMNAWLNAGGSS